MQMPGNFFIYYNDLNFQYMRNVLIVIDLFNNKLLKLFYTGRVCMYALCFF